MRIIGVDPGSINCGYGIVDYENDKLTVIEYGIIKPKSGTNEPNSSFLQRLKYLFDTIYNILTKYHIDETAIETQFYHNNAQSLMKLTQARTSIELSSLVLSIPVFEYTPREIKLSITGKGNATKKSVRFMVNSIFNLNIEQKHTDISDALAVAFCHISKKGKARITKNSPRTWREFVEMNTDKIIRT